MTNVQATCGLPLFEDLAALAKLHSLDNAKEAVYLVSGLSLSAAGPSPELVKLTENQLQATVEQITIDGSECIIGKSREFALLNLDLEIGESAISGLQSASNLEKPFSSFAKGTVLSGLGWDPAKWAFGIKRVEVLLSWLRTVNSTC